MRTFDWLRRQLKDRRSRRQVVSAWFVTPDPADDAGAGAVAGVAGVYLANPKAASSGIRNLIRDRESQRLFGQPAGEDRTRRARVERRIKQSLTPAAAARLRDTHWPFSFVRNPLTRLHSCYRDKLVNAASKRDRCSLSVYGIEFGISFDEFVRRVADIPDDRADQHFRSQHTFLTHGDELLVHHLGQLEHFDDHWRAIQSRLGLTPPKHEHRVSGPPVAARQLPLTRAAAERARQRYQRDIELFGYHDQIATLIEDLPPECTSKR